MKTDYVLPCDACEVLVENISIEEIYRVFDGGRFHCDRCTDPNVDYGVER